MEKWKDSNVQKVSELLKDRMERGFLKYGTTTERTDLNKLEWLQHLQEELLDAAVYIERLKQEFNKAVDINLNLDNNMNSFTSYGDTITVSGMPDSMTGFDTSITITGNDVTLDLTNQGAAMPVISTIEMTDSQNEFPASFQVSRIVKD